MVTRFFVYLSMVLVAVVAVDVEFYWTTVEKLKTDEIQTSLYTLLNQLCFSSNSTKTECGVDVSSDLVNKSSISLTNPTQDKFNVAVTVAATYDVNNITFPFTNSQLLTFLQKSTVRQTLKQEVGLWLEKVGEDQYPLPADTQNNIIISLLFVALTLIILIITLVLMKLEDNAKEEERKAKIREIKRMTDNDQAYKVRPGPSPIDRWPFMHQKPPKDTDASNFNSTSVTMPNNHPKTVTNNGNSIQAQPSSQSTSRILESPALLSNDRSTVNVGNDSLITNDTELSYVMTEQGTGPKLPPLGETSFTEKKRKKKSKKKRKELDEESTTREETERSEVRHDIERSDNMNQGYVEDI